MHSRGMSSDRRRKHLGRSTTFNNDELADDWTADDDWAPGMVSHRSIDDASEPAGDIEQPSAAVDRTMSNSGNSPPRSIDRMSSNPPESKLDERIFGTLGTSSRRTTSNASLALELELTATDGTLTQLPAGGSVSDMEV